VAAGAIEAAYSYSLKRKQFGKSIAAFQINQERIAKSVQEVNAMILLCHRVS